MAKEVGAPRLEEEPACRLLLVEAETEAVAEAEAEAEAGIQIAAVAEVATVAESSCNLRSSGRLLQEERREVVRVGGLGGSS